MTLSLMTRTRSLLKMARLGGQVYISFKGDAKMYLRELANINSKVQRSCLCYPVP